MYLAIIVLPLLGSIVSGFFGRKVGVLGAQYITSLCIAISTCIAILIFYEVGLNSTSVSVLAFRWLDSESLNVLWGFNFDSLTVSMLIPVLIVSCLVHIYSINYMSHDPHNQRFFSYLSLFTFMMIILITANNFLLMFVGWEGVGVCSYLLVSFWFTRIAANQSSVSAFLTNRVGDYFLTLGMFIMLLVFGNLDFTTIFSLAPFISEKIITIIGICLLIGAMAKSSQIGLHVWLPLAMEGPTPVSALIHAATMVTAGVYLLIRASPLIEYSSTMLVLCLWIGGITTIFSSLIGLFQQDIKKVIAYSTMSQLGMMVIAIGLSSYNIALFHLINHAFYKGLLFLGAGAVIHVVADNQDFRKYGGFLIFLPLTYTVMLTASLSLVAFPFMTGFYSKDFILESAYAQYRYSGVAIYFIATLAAVFTTLYSVKVLYLTFLGRANGPIIGYANLHENNMFISLPIITLALFSIFFGYLSKDIFIGLASGFFTDNSLFIHPLHEISLAAEFAVPIFFKLLPLISTIFFSICYFILSELLPLSLIYLKYTRFGYNLFNFFNLRFLIEYLYNKFVTSFILELGGQTNKVLDKGSVELLGPYGLEKGLLNISKNISKLDTGIVTSYALYILIALVLYIQLPYIYYKDMSIILLILYGLLINTLLSNKLYKVHAFIKTVFDVNGLNINVNDKKLHDHDIIIKQSELFRFYNFIFKVKYSNYLQNIFFNNKIKKYIHIFILFIIFLLSYKFLYCNDISIENVNYFTTSLWYYIVNIYLYILDILDIFVCFLGKILKDLILYVVNEIKNISSIYTIINEQYTLPLNSYNVDENFSVSHKSKNNISITNFFMEPYGSNINPNSSVNPNSSSSVNINPNNSANTNLNSSVNNFLPNQLQPIRPAQPVNPLFTQAYNPSQPLWRQPYRQLTWMPPYRPPQPAEFVQPVQPVRPIQWMELHNVEKNHNYYYPRYNPNNNPNHRFGFWFTNNSKWLYAVNDPKGIAKKGFIDAKTGFPHSDADHQSLLKNIYNALLDRHKTLNFQNEIEMDYELEPDIFRGPVAAYFYQYLDWEYPDWRTNKLRNTNNFRMIMACKNNYNYRACHVQNYQ